MKKFDERITEAVIGHMNDDHPEDSLLIARAFGAPQAEKSVMVDLDAHGGIWRVTEGSQTNDLRVNWPSGEISERPEIRREVVLLYREACEKLGVTPRPHEEPPTDQPQATQEAETAVAGNAAPEPFSQTIREGTWVDHEDSEGADFMASIMKGKASREDYAELAAQHFFMYEALESVVADYAEHPLFAPFYEPALDRMVALERDLELLFGEDWREKIEPVPATVAYAARIREVGADAFVPGVIAHHYTRYLGDLSGGQMISRRVAKQHNFADGRGVEFYDFATLGSIAKFKERYRVALDQLGAQLTAEQRSLMLDEVRTAYRFNTEVFIDMAREKAKQ